MFKLVLEKAEEPETNCQHPLDHWKSNKIAEKHLFLLIDYAKAFDCVDHNKLWEIWKRWEYQTTWPAFWETYMQVRRQQLELDMEQQAGSK